MPWRRLSPANTPVTVLALFTIVGAGFSIANYAAFVGIGRPVTLVVLVFPFIFWYVYAAFTPAISWFARRYPNLSIRHAWNYAGGYAALVAVHTAVMWPIAVAFSSASRPVRNPGWVAVSVASKDIFFAAAVMTGVLVFHYYEAAERARIVRSELQSSLARAQLDVLNNQIQPHFLFNTLNAITALARVDAAATRRVITLLIDLLAAAFAADGSAQVVPLRKELRLLQDYAAILRTRFSDSLTIVFSVPNGALEALVPHFSLQPLVENVIKHAADEHGRLHIEIDARLAENRLTVTVADHGPGVAERKTGRVGTGLANLERRLATLYGTGASLEMRNRARGNGAEVVLVVPQTSLPLGYERS